MRSDAHHRHAKDVLLLCSETEGSRDVVFPWRHPARIPQMAVHRVRRGDIWVLELVWVRDIHAVSRLRLIADLLYSDFFPVILTFLRQLPFIGTFLTLPYVRDVRGGFAAFFLSALRSADISLFVDTGCGSFSRVETIRSMTSSRVAQNGRTHHAIAPEGGFSALCGQRNWATV